MADELLVAQPAPANADGVSCWDLVFADVATNPRMLDLCRQRDAFGRAKYGVPLVATNGRDHVADAVQEALDLVVYLKAHALTFAPEADRRAADSLYWHAVGLAGALVRYADERKEAT